MVHKIDMKVKCSFIIESKYPTMRSVVKIEVIHSALQEQSRIKPTDYSGYENKPFHYCKTQISPHSN